ncbi:MAG: hypothetical protein WC734_01865 [Patescibacteria group bacterium]|jgi:hypothetical protein
MIILNLLPFEKKHSIAIEHTRRLQKKLVAIFMTSLVLCLAILLATNWYIGYELKSTEEQISSVRQMLSSHGGDSNAQIEAMNEQIAQLQGIQKEHIIWPSIIGQLSNTTVSGITLNTISFDAALQTVTLTGTALTRQNLVAYKEKLAAISFVSNIESPLSDLIQRENINFEFKGKFTYSPTAQ